MHKWIDENVSAKFHVPGDVEVLVAKSKADAQEADFAPDDIEYEPAEFIATLILEVMQNRGGH